MTDLPAQDRGIEAAGLRTRRYERRRSAIVDAAAAAINRDGLKNLSVSDLAVGLGLNSTSITYYFKRKELLAAACFERSLDLLEAQVEEALSGDGVEQRVALFVKANFAALPRILGTDETHPAIVRLSDMRASDEAVRVQIVERYFRIFKTARRIFGPEDGLSKTQRIRRLMQTHILLEAMHAMQSWIGRYAREEYGRVERRMIELLVSGLTAGAREAVLEPADVPVEASAGESQSARFLDVATQLINFYGYRGASVNRIAAELNVTKGSFYHHHDAKDDLVLECYRQSLDRFEAALTSATETAPDPLDQIASALMTLVSIQFGPDTPLVRSTALEALPNDLRTQVVDRSNRIARRLAGMVIDGISEGSVNTVDPLVCGQLLMSSLNVAFELRALIQREQMPGAAQVYCRLLLYGLAGDDRT